MELSWGVVISRMIVLACLKGTMSIDNGITPQPIRGDWDTIWTSSLAKYEMPYSVHFGTDGTFEWWAPYMDGIRVEVGWGKYLSSVSQIVNSDGSWEAHYFGANKLVPDKSNGTNCCCEYVGSAGPGHPTVLADYFIKIVLNSDLDPIKEVCAPYAVECPADNATASRLLGNPFIEVYERPWVLHGKKALVKEEKVLQILLASFATASCMLLLCLSMRKCLAKRRLSMEVDDLNKIEGLDVDHSGIKRIKFTVPKIGKDNDGDDDKAETPSTPSPSSSAPNSPRATTSSGSQISRNSSGISSSMGFLMQSPPSTWIRRFTDSALPSGQSPLKMPLVAQSDFV